MRGDRPVIYGKPSIGKYSTSVWFDCSRPSACGFNTIWDGHQLFRVGHHKRSIYGLQASSFVLRNLA